MKNDVRARVGPNYIRAVWEFALALGWQLMIARSLVWRRMSGEWVLSQ
jgi:hypothetical protein